MKKKLRTWDGKGILDLRYGQCNIIRLKKCIKHENVYEILNKVVMI